LLIAPASLNGLLCMSGGVGGMNPEALEQNEMREEKGDD
jgi:hypothetical protein